MLTVFQSSAQLAKEIGNLYLNERFSDVTIVIDGTEIPAHRMILSERCPYFETMFESGMLESTSKQIELHETSIDVFKIVLKWIYKAEVIFNQIDTALEVLHLSDMYQLLELVNLAAQFIGDNCGIDNVCLVLNSTSLLSMHCSLLNMLVAKHGFDTLAREAFVNLSKNAIYPVLKNVDGVSNVKKLKALKQWMNSIPTNRNTFWISKANCIKSHELWPQPN